MITIKVLDKEMTLDEARELYNELHQMFGKEAYDYRPLSPLERTRVSPEWQNPYIDPLNPLKVTC